mmetsp:Transcript_15634/g.27429  ORF Transcript_15634/g.27429 Transcript_15634/m.27429 type:complete len:300 (+) Transcript_15634:51-950(+)|eukprot:CAMPEP_0184692084 /NCGR_PEP_ID=MMETSP0313-20130426/708_1 /TAXON_ID=2792 /ORGANISM="Porphyridium aerugineum, Strain SAG 1380-2" /LENGTH=299 /DNA_ID=CAMNT_0027149889 /DNA_START=50 /DNA_END=949 /DNA_ORIENTATION=+
MNSAFIPTLGGTSIKSQRTLFVTSPISPYPQAQAQALAQAQARSNNKAIVYMGRRAAKIAVRKGKQEMKRVKLYSRVGKLIIAAIREGGDSPNSNAALAAALDQAKLANFPKDNIERLIKKATSKDQADYKVSLYDLYGAGGCGMLIQVFTDNNNRAMSDMRTVLNRYQTSLASAGSVAFNFDKMGVIEIAIDKNPSIKGNEDELLLAAIDAGAVECEPSDEVGEDNGSGGFEILTDPKDLNQVRLKLAEAGYVIDSAGFAMIPKTYTAVSDEDAARNFTLIEALEGIDDVDAVFHNME